jgi:hypothetical protein
MSSRVGTTVVLGAASVACSTTVVGAPDGVPVASSLQLTGTSARPASSSPHVIRAAVMTPPPPTEGASGRRVLARAPEAKADLTGVLEDRRAALELATTIECAPVLRRLQG